MLWDGDLAGLLSVGREFHDGYVGWSAGGVHGLGREGALVLRRPRDVPRR